MTNLRSIPDVITIDWLRSLGVCKRELSHFRELWPDGAFRTGETIDEAAACGFDLRWLAERIFGSRAALWPLDRAIEALKDLVGVNDYRRRWALSHDELARLLGDDDQARRQLVADRPILGALVDDLNWRRLRAGRLPMGAVA